MQPYMSTAWSLHLTFLFCVISSFSAVLDILLRTKILEYVKFLGRHHFPHKTLTISFGQRPKKNVENACVRAACGLQGWGSTGGDVSFFDRGGKNWRKTPYMTDMKPLIGPQTNATLRSLEREGVPLLGVGCAWTSRSLGLYGVFPMCLGKRPCRQCRQILSLGEVPASVISWRQGSILIFANPRS